MGFFDKRKQEKQEKSVFVLLHLNARLQPMHRQEFFEEVLKEIVTKYKLGKFMGGGTLQKATGEIVSCDVEMMIRKEKLEQFLTILYEMDNIPKGSTVIVGNEEREIGTAEGLAVYLNGTDLSPAVYENCDINYLIEMLDIALEDIILGFSYWEGSRETALYYYGRSYKEMKGKIMPILDKYPLCALCRIEEIT